MNTLKLDSKSLEQVISLSIIGIIIISTSVIVGQGFDLDHEVNDEQDDDLKEQKPLPKNLEGMSSDRSLIRVIDDGDDVGEHTSIDIFNGQIYISYYSAAEKSLKLARNSSNSMDEWYIWTIDNEGDVGKYSSIDVVESEDVEGDGEEVHVAYYDSSNRNLKYLIWTEIETRDPEVIDDEEDVGRYVSIRVHEGTTHMSYYDASEGQLRYAVQKDGGWDITPFDHGRNVGQYTSIDVDDGGSPHIAHYDWKERNLMYTRKVGIRWENDSFGGQNTHLGRHASLILDSFGSVHIACHEWTDEDYRLKYVTDKNGTLKGETVDEETPYVGTHASITIDKDGDGDPYPVISYHRWDEENLKLAWKEDGGWTIERVESDHRVGSHTSVVMKRKGEAHVSYHDKVDGNLKYARVFTINRTPLSPLNFNTSSEYGDILLEWNPPLYDGIPDGNDSILGYNLYRKRESSGHEDFEMLAEDITGLSYRDDIPKDSEFNTYSYKVAAVNKLGEGDNSTLLRTRAKYFDYDMIGRYTNRYTIEELFPLEGKAETDPYNYELRWDFSYDENGGGVWDEENIFFEGGHEEVEGGYEEVGLKNVMLEIVYDGKKRRCLQSAWVLGKYRLTSTYEMEGSNEVFFHMMESLVPDIADEGSGLKNKYVFYGHKDLPYRAVNFTFDDDVKHSEGGEELDQPVEPEYIAEEFAFWNRTFTVSDADGDTEVVVDPVLYNEYRDSFQEPFGSDFDKTNDLNQKEVDMIETPRWIYPLLKQTGYISVENIGEGEHYHGWNLEFEFDGEGENEGFLDISSRMPSGISKLEDYFGGDYGFELETFPDETIKFNNEKAIETKLLTFSTDVGEDSLPSGEIEGKFGKSISYSGETEIDVSANIHLFMIIDPVSREIGVDGYLEFDFGAELKIDIPLKSIGIAEVGLTAEIGGGFNVEAEIGGLSYRSGEGVVPRPPSKTPIEMNLDFGGGPYAEAAAGLARVEGKFICGLKVGLEMPTREKELTLEGRFEVVAEAAWGLWEKSRSWELFSEEMSSRSVHANPDFLEYNQKNEIEIYSTDRLYTREYSMGPDHGVGTPSFSVNSDDSAFLDVNVAPGADPRIAFVGEDSGLAVWGDLTRSNNGVTSNLYTRTYDDGEWGEKEMIDDLAKTSYSPELIRLNDEELMMLYMGIDDELNEDNAAEDFFEGNSIRAKIWSLSTGWSQLPLNYSVDDEPITSFDVSAEDGEVYLAYRAGESHFDIFNSSTATDGNIGLIRLDIGQDGSIVTGEWDIEEYMPATSTPAVEFINGKAGLSYIRNVPYDEEREERKENCYNETVLVKIDEAVGSIGEMQFYSVRETENTTSHVILSKENDDMVVSWVENHSTIKRRKVNLENSEWTMSDIDLVYSGRTVSSLATRENETGLVYTFQGGEKGVPTVIRSKGDNWGYLQSLSKEDRYSHGQLSSVFDVKDPMMIYVEEEEIIEGWHTAHYTFNLIENGRVEDETEYINTGDLEGNYTIKRHDDDKTIEYGDYIEFGDETGRISVPSSSSLNVTDENDDFTVTSLLRLGEDSAKNEDENAIIQKEGSWAVKIRENDIVIVLWDDSEKEIKELEPQDVELSEWFFLGVRFERVDNEISYLNVTVMNKYKSLNYQQFIDQTETFLLKNFGGIDSSSEPLKLGSHPDKMAIDDFRLIERYLPDASIMKIYSTIFPNFNRKRDIRVRPVPPFVNFTHPEHIGAGYPVEFEGHSPSGGLNWTWNFDGGEKKYGKTVEFTFDRTGHHEVELKAVHDRTGAMAYHEKSIHVIDIDPPDFEGIADYSVENNSLELRWEEADDISEPIRYRIHHVKGEQTFDHSIWVKSTYENSTVLKGLAPHVAHHVKVTAENNLGLENNDTSTISFTLEDNLDPEFDGLEHVYTSDHSSKTIYLKWSPAVDDSEPITYHIYHSRKENMSFKDPIDKVEARDYIEITVSEIGPHYFAVRAEDSVGNMERNEVVKGVSLVDAEPPTVEVITPEEDSQVLSSVLVEWKGKDNYSGISHYQVKSDHHEIWEILETDETNVKYMFENLPDGERTLTVKAVDAEDNHAKDSVTVEVVGSYQSPEVKLGSPGDNSRGISTSPTLSVWVSHLKDVVMEVSFYQRTSDEDTLIGTEQEVYSEGSASVEWTGLKENTTYDWYVLVEDDVQKVLSDTWSFKTVKRSSMIEVTDLDIAPIYGEVPLLVSITGDIENHGTEEDKVDLSIYYEASTEIGSWTYSLGPNDSKTVKESYEIDESGAYTITFGDEEEDVTVVEEGEMKLKPHFLDAPEEILLGETAAIETGVENLQEVDEHAYIYVENEEVHRETIPGREKKIFETQHSFGGSGDFTIEVKDSRDETILRESISVVDEPIEYPPDEPVHPRPGDGSVDISISPILAVEVDHPDHIAMDVSFYQKEPSEDTLIGIEQGVDSGETASIQWNGLKENTTYGWYVIVEDGSNEIVSDTWAFRTLKSSSMIEVDDLKVDPVYGEIPLTISITGEIENHGKREGGIELSIKSEGSEKINSWTYSLGPSELKIIEESYQIDRTGLYTISLGVEEEDVTVLEEGEMKLKPHFLDTPEEILLGETAVIETGVENLQEVDEHAYIYVENEEVHRETISSNEKKIFETEHSFGGSGDFAVEVKDSRDETILRESISVVDEPIEYPPDRPVDPRPHDGSEDISTSPTLNVDVNHPDEAVIDVSFYRKGSDEDVLIGSYQGIEGRGTASVDWGDLKRNTTYSWYAIVEDRDNKNVSDTWIFTTGETGRNNPPDPPSLIEPKDASTSLGSNVTLAVEVNDKDGDLLNVTFYDVIDDQQIAPTRSEVPTGSTVEVEWDDLSYDRGYEWKVIVDDGENITHSPTWSFDTMEKEEEGRDDEDDDREHGMKYGLSLTQILLIFILGALISLGLWMWYEEDHLEDKKEKDRDEDGNEDETKDRGEEDEAES